MYDLGALIRSLRKERKITQKKLGEMLDVTEGTISKYEANTMTPPFETLRSIASIFNVSMDTLCGMKHQGTLSTHGLTEAQTETVKALVDAYRVKNAQTGRQLSREYEDKLVWRIIGRIFRKIVIPVPIRNIMSVIKSLKYINGGVVEFGQAVGVEHGVDDDADDAAQGDGEPGLGGGDAGAEGE